MSNLGRRSWLKKSVLGSGAILSGGFTSYNYCRPYSSVDEFNDGYMRLNWNENPLGPSESAKSAIIKAANEANHYPDALISNLKGKLASRFELKSNNFMITSGSTEILCLMGQYAGIKSGEILTPWPSFPTIVMFGSRCGASSKKVNLGSDYRIDFNRLTEAISPNTKVISICNPNNPTSTQINSEELRQFCRSVSDDIVILVDEAYIEFSKNGAQSSVVDLVNELPNVVICRTFSKGYGLAGLRLGYAISTPENIQLLQSRHTGLDFSISGVTVAAALASLDDAAFIDECVRSNQKGRDIVYGAFDKWGVKYAESATNFIYTKSNRFDVNVVAKLKKENILITKWPTMTDHIRISIQTPPEMEIFVDRVEQFLV